MGQGISKPQIKCTLATWAGKNAVKVTVPAKWDHKLGLYKVGPNGHKVEKITKSKKVVKTSAPKQKKPEKTVKGVIQHPDLSFQIPKTDKNNEKLLTALNARQNGISAAHHLGQNKNTVLVTFDRETLPLSVVPSTSINEGKSLTVMVTKQKPVRCTGCQGHGHTAGACPTGTVICPYCGYNHRYNECQVRKRPYYYQCWNCYSNGYEHRGHGAFDDKCPVLRDYLVHLDRVQKEKDALRRNITAQVANTITSEAEAKQIKSNLNPQEPRQPIIKAARKLQTKTKTPTKEVTNTNGGNQQIDVITKGEVMDLICTLDRILSDKLEWGHRGLISEIAREQLYGPTTADVDMTSTTPTRAKTPTMPGNTAEPKNLFASRFNAPPVVDTSTPKSTPTAHTFNTKGGQTIIADKIKNTPSAATSNLVFDAQAHKYNREAGANLTTSTPVNKKTKTNVKMSPEAASSPFVEIQTEQTKTGSPLTTSTMVTNGTLVRYSTVSDLSDAALNVSPLNGDVSDDSDVGDVSDVSGISSDSSVNSNANNTPRSPTSISRRRIRKKFLRTAKGVAKLDKINKNIRLNST